MYIFLENFSKNTRFKKSYFFKTGHVYGIFIKFARCTGSKPGGFKKWAFWGYWEIVKFFGIKKSKTLDFTRFSGTIAILRSNHVLTTQI